MSETDRQLAVCAPSTQAPLFKKPKRPKKKRKVLEEDAFVETLDDIITRDFFPDLPKLRTQLEMLETQDADAGKLRELQRRQQEVAASERRSAQQSQTFETPVSAQQSSNPVSDTPLTGDSAFDEDNVHSTSDKSSDASSLSLDQFLATHTSEDNASFTEIIDNMNERKREKYRWLYDQERKSDEASQRLAIEGPSAIGRDGPTAICNYKVANALMYNPEGVELSHKEEIERFGGASKEIHHSNTRFHSNFITQQQQALRNRLQEIKSQTRGPEEINPTWAMLEAEQRKMLMEKQAMKQTSFDLDAMRTTPHANGLESPRVNGYGFVATPTPVPGMGGESPFVTWGEVEGTPLRLEENETPLDFTPGPQFAMSEPVGREKVAMELAEKASESVRKKKGTTLRTPQRMRTPQSGSRTPSASPLVSRLSEAGRRLADRQRKRKGAGFLDSQLRASYGSTPDGGGKKAKGTPYRLSVTSTPATPKGSAGATPRDEGRSLTDNLLVK